MDLTVLSVAREGGDMKIGLRGGGRQFDLVLMSVLDQAALFGDELPEEDLVGSQLRVGPGELERISKRRTFIAVFRDADERERSYLCERAR